MNNIRFGKLFQVNVQGWTPEQHREFTVNPKPKNLKTVGTMVFSHSMEKTQMNFFAENKLWTVTGQDLVEITNTMDQKIAQHPEKNMDEIRDASGLEYLVHHYYHAEIVTIDPKVESYWDENEKKKNSNVRNIGDDGDRKNTSGNSKSRGWDDQEKDWDSRYL